MKTHPKKKLHGDIRFQERSELNTLSTFKDMPVCTCWLWVTVLVIPPKFCSPAPLVMHVMNTPSHLRSVHMETWTKPTNQPPTRSEPVGLQQALPQSTWFVIVGTFSVAAWAGLQCKWFVFECILLSYSYAMVYGMLQFLRPCELQRHKCN